MPNGGFESGTGGWSLSRVRATSGNESWSVRAAGDSKSLAIDASGTAVSPTVCIDTQPSDLPLLRAPDERQLGRAQPARALAGLVGPHERDDDRGPRQQLRDGVARIARLNIASLLGLWNADQDASVQLVFDPENYGGSWAIDDVYVDPYGRG